MDLDVFSQVGADEREDMAGALYGEAAVDVIGFRADDNLQAVTVHAVDRLLSSIT